MTLVIPVLQKRTLRLREKDFAKATPIRKYEEGLQPEKSGSCLLWCRKRMCREWTLLPTPTSKQKEGI